MFCEMVCTCFILADERRVRHAHRRVLLVWSSYVFYLTIVNAIRLYSFYILLL